MAGIFYDSFDHYATADIATKWTQNNSGTINSSNGRRSGGCMQLPNGSSVRITPTSPVPSGATCIVGFAFRHVSGFSGSSTVEDLADTLLAIRQGGSTQVWARINADATISVLRGTTVLGTTSNALSQNVYAYIELKVVIDPSAGTVDLRVNGASWLSLSSQNTRSTSSSTWNELKIGINQAGTVQYDDLYLFDGSGSVNNAFLGDIRVDAVFPNAAGNSSQFTRSTGSDQSATIDEAAPNGDSDYNETATATNRDTLNFPNAPVTGASIFAIQGCAYAKKTDAGGAGLKLVTRISSTDYDGTEVSLGTPYNYARQVWDQNPAAAAAWTDTVFNAAEFGYVKST